PPTGCTSASITAGAGARGTTPRGSSATGRRRSRAGGSGATFSPTSTTTGAAMRSPMASRWRRHSRSLSTPPGTRADGVASEISTVVTPSAARERPREQDGTRAIVLAWHLRRRAGMEIDIVCGMEVDPTDAPAQAEYAGKVYYFCSNDCLREFEDD